MKKHIEELEDFIDRRLKHGGNDSKEDIIQCIQALALCKIAEELRMKREFEQEPEVHTSKGLLTYVLNNPSEKQKEAILEWQEEPGKTVCEVLSDDPDELHHRGFTDDVNPDSRSKE